MSGAELHDFLHGAFRFGWWLIGVPIVLMGAVALRCSLLGHRWADYGDRRQCERCGYSERVPPR